jgi:drug/metabolite transporter (DMT)-like permease
MSDAALGYLLAVAALLLFGSGILVTKFAASRISLDLGFLIATATNVAFAALALTVQLAFQPGALAWNAQAFWLFAAAGGFSTYLGRWFFYEAVVRFGPAKASVFQVSSPLFTALIAWLWLGEHLSLMAAAGMVMAIAGLMLVSYKPRGQAVDAAVAQRVPVAAISPAPADLSNVTAVQAPNLMREKFLQSVLLLGLGSSFAYAIGNVLRGAAVRSWNEPVVGALVGAVLGLALHLAFSADKKGLVARLKQANRQGIWLYALMGVCTISGQMCLIGAMRFIPVSVATLMTLCTPLLVFPLSHLLFKNSGDVTRNTVLGGALALTGIAIIVMR